LSSHIVAFDPIAQVKHVVFFAAVGKSSNATRGHIANHDKSATRSTAHFDQRIMTSKIWTGAHFIGDPRSEGRKLPIATGKLDPLLGQGYAQVAHPQTYCLLARCQVQKMQIFSLNAPNTQNQNPRDCEHHGAKSIWYLFKKSPTKLGVLR